VAANVEASRDTPMVIEDDEDDDAAENGDDDDEMEVFEPESARKRLRGNDGRFIRKT
jgi:hypothetical protein